MATKSCHKSNVPLSIFSIITFLKHNIFKGYMYMYLSIITFVKYNIFKGYMCLPIMTCLSAEMIVKTM